MKKTSHRPADLRLKIAIIESRRTQRRVAVDTRIGETRLSEIVGHRSTPPSAIEKDRLVTYLNRARAANDLPPLTITDLFETAEDDAQIA